MTSADFKKLVEIRIAEAQALFAARLYSGAYYLAGYAVEFAFKVCLAQRTRRNEFPEKDFVNKCHTHDLHTLHNTCSQLPLPAVSAVPPAMAAHWQTVRDWKESARYQRKTKQQAKDLLTAITDPVHGILTWIKTHW